MRRLDNLSKALGTVQVFGPLDRARLAAWVADAAKQRGKALDAGARAELPERAGPGLGTLERELDKLAAYVGDRATITRDDVIAIVPESAEYSIFKMCDAVAEGQPRAALHILRGLRANNEPALKILPMLARQFRLVWQAKLLAEDRGGAERLPREPNLLRSAPFVQEKARRQARRMSWETLRRGLRLLLEKDLALKGVEGPPADEDEALETLIVALCG
jgi:DNA polymerase-3 subunit delta